MNLDICSTPNMAWSRAIFLTVICLFSSVFFMDIKSPNTDPVKIKIARYLTLSLVALAFYYWYQYFKVKKYRLIITEGKLSWGSELKQTEIDWVEIKILTVVNLGEISKQTGWCYEFHLKSMSSVLDGPITLMASDYAISHQELMQIFQKQAEQYGFEFKASY